MNCGSTTAALVWCVFAVSFPYPQGFLLTSDVRVTDNDTAGLSDTSAVPRLS